MRCQNLTMSLTGRLLLLGGLGLGGLGAAQTAPATSPPATTDSALSAPAENSQGNAGQLGTALPLPRPATAPATLLGGAGNTPARQGSLLGSSGAVSGCALPPGPLPSQTRAVFVLDTSGSMRGIGDGKADIFDRVKDSVEQYVDSVHPDQVKLITFDSGVRGERSYDLPAQATALRSDLDGLKANGNNTYLYRSMHAALSPLAASDRYVTSVFVMTDGIDNDPQPRYSAEGALSSFQARGTLDTLAYIALGSSIPDDAKNALAASDYASGMTLPPGEVPDLVALSGGVRLATVTDPQRVPAPFADGTPLSLAAQDSRVALARPDATVGSAALQVSKDVPAGSAALLCAPPAPDPNVVGPRTRRVLLKLQMMDGAKASDAAVSTVPASAPGTPQTPPATGTTTTTTSTTTTQTTAQPGQPATRASDLAGLLWLNPGATSLSQGQETVLRYRATGGLPLDGAQLLLPAGLTGFTAALERQPGASEFAVRVQRSADSASDAALANTLPGGLLTPRLLLPTGQVINLTPLQVAGLASSGAGNTVLPVGPASGAAPTTNGTTAGTTTPSAGTDGQTTTPPTATTQNPATQPPNVQTPNAQSTNTQAPTDQNTATQAPQTQNSQAQNAQTQTQTQRFPWWILLLLALLGLIALIVRRGMQGATGTKTMAAAAVKGNRPPPTTVRNARTVIAPVPVPVAATPAAPAAPSRVEGLHYRDDRTLALVGLDGEVRGIPTPLAGAFDLGQVSRAADLRGLRAEQVTGGLELIQIPDDLLVAQNTHLLASGDLVVPGTLLSVIPTAAGVRSSLGSLTGLGRPLMLRANGAQLEITGPYGDHLLSLTPGILDLGETLEAPALRGLKLSTRGYHIMLTDLPQGVTLTNAADQTPIRAGMYLPERTGLLLRGL